MENYDYAEFLKGLEYFDITLTEKQLQQFTRFYELLNEWNKVMNLTAITEWQEVLSKHFLDSLSIVKVMDFSKVETILDLGTGAGFPGIPLKILFPDKKFVLLDSLNKRIKFLDTVVNELGLTNIELIHGRAEDFAKKKEYREQFDLCVSRAVANLATLSEYCIPYVKKNGYFVSYKAITAKEELVAAQKAIGILGGELVSTEEFLLPDSDITRAFIVIKKERNTSPKYPRKAGLPAKEPLGK